MTPGPTEGEGRQRLAPIAIFAYNRPDHLRRTLDHLARCAEYSRSPVTIFCDGARTPAHAEAVAATRAIARELVGAKGTVVERVHNLGLAASVIAGVTDLCSRHGRVVVLEDDLLVQPGFLRFMNGALDAWADAPRVMQVSGFMFPIQEFAARTDAFFIPFVETQGWATWDRAWRAFDPACTGWERVLSDRDCQRRFDVDDSYHFSDLLRWQMEGKLDTWGVRWYWSVFQSGGLTLCPPQSLVEQIGSDGSGTHGSILWRRYAERRAGLTPVDALTWPRDPAVDRAALSLIERELRALGGGAMRPAVKLWRRARFALRHPVPPRPASAS